MKCFYHHDRDAVGTCKSCQRGLCPECAVELEKGLACRSHCEEEAKQLIRYIDNSIALMPTVSRRIKAARRTGVYSALFYIICGALFCRMSIHRHIDLLTALGAVFVIYGLIVLVNSLRMTRAQPKAL